MLMIPLGRMVLFFGMDLTLDGQDHIQSSGVEPVGLSIHNFDHVRCSGVECWDLYARAMVIFVFFPCCPGILFWSG